MTEKELRDFIKHSGFAGAVMAKMSEKYPMDLDSIGGTSFSGTSVK